MDQRREKAARFHGVWRRYRNIIDQSGISIGSETLHSHYGERKDYLEQAQIYCSVYAHESTFVSIFTSLENAQSHTEYLLSYCPNGWDHGHKELRAMQASLITWGSQMARRKVAFISTSDEVFSLTEYGPSDLAKINDDKLVILDDIQKKILASNIQCMVFSVYDHPTAQLIANANADDKGKEEHTEKLKILVNETFGDDAKMFKADFR